MNKLQDKNNLKPKWFYKQSAVKLLNISENEDGVIVSLLCYVSEEKPFSKVLIWKLPFKQNNIRAFLMYPHLSDLEKNNTLLIELLKSDKADFHKFEELIKFRLSEIVKSLKADKIDSNSYDPKSIYIGINKGHFEFLIYKDSVLFQPNAFIKSVLEQNKL